MLLLHNIPLDMLPPRAAGVGRGGGLVWVRDGRGGDLPFVPGASPPYGSVAVVSASGPSRIVAMRRRTDNPFLGPDEGEPLILGTDILELAEELDVSSCRRLLAFLLGFCRKAFDLSGDGDFIRSCLRLARLCAMDEGAMHAVARIGPAWMVLRGAPVPRGSTLFILSADKVRQSAAPCLDGEADLTLIETVRAGDLLLTVGDDPSFWTVQDPAASTADLLKSGAPGHKLRAACLQALLPACPITAALFQEAVLMQPAAVRRSEDAARPVSAALEAAIPDGEGRIFLRGWLRDPVALVADAELCTPMGHAAIEPSELHRVPRPDLNGQFSKSAFAEDPDARLGFIAWVADPSRGLFPQPTLALRLRSGSRMALTPPLRHCGAAFARGTVLSSVRLQDVTPALLETCLDPAAAAFHRQATRRSGTAERVAIGTPLAKPAITIIVPLYRNLGFLRFQLSALANDPECRAAELIIALDSPEQRAETEHLLRGLHAIHGLPMTLLVMPHNLGYAAANNEAAACARGSALLLLNSDVVPAQSGWLGRLHEALQEQGVGAVGPKLLFDDESIQHAGLYFERGTDGLWLNAHYHKGMPWNWPAAQRRCRVPGVTGAALMVHRALFERVGGICEEYIVGDYEDSDLCLRIHASGHTITYVPTAELFHFERRSISLHTGYTGTLASHYNRRLQHHRWDAAISELMLEAQGCDAARRAA